MLTMETLKEEQEQDDNQLAQKTTTISFPMKIILEILSRLPVKPLLQFRSVSKQWLSLISKDPSFAKLHIARSIANPHTAFFIPAYDTFTDQLHFLSAPYDGGPVTRLITIHNAHHEGAPYHNTNYETTEAEHLNGLVLFTSRGALWEHNYAFVVNPATRKVFKLPHPPNSKESIYFFGFDESKNEHKILSISRHTYSGPTKFYIFSLSSYCWRMIYVEEKEVPPFLGSIQHSVCVNSVIHFMLHSQNQILAFDLTTKKFSTIKLPHGVIPRKSKTRFTRKGQDTFKSNSPFLIKDNGLLGVVCHDRVVETNEMHVWVLQDYVNRVWVRETITFSESWIELDGLVMSSFYPDMVNLVFSCRRLSKDMISGFILDMKTKSFKLVNFNLGYKFMHSKTLKFRQVRSYAESIFPLREEWTMTQ